MTVGDRMSSVCSVLKYACCEPRAGDYDSCSDDGNFGNTGGLGEKEIHCGRQQQQQEQHHQRQQPSSVLSSETSKSAAKCNRGREVNSTNFGELYCRERDRLSLNKIRASRSPSHEDFTDEVRSRNGGLSDGAWVDSPYTDATRMASPATQEASALTNEEKTPTQDSRRGQVLVSSGRPSSDMPPRAPTKKSRWTDDVLEGFLYSTLVDGTGLVLDKLDSEGKGKRCGERILSYDPDAMRLNWISTGMRRKPGSMLAKDIDDVLCKGTAVTIFYSRAGTENRDGGGGGGAVAAAATPGRRRSLSPWRRSSVSTGQTKVGRRRKAFQVAEERDAQILAELMLFVRRRALVAACTSATGADAASSRSAASPGASSASAGSSVSDAGSYPDSYGGGISLTGADDAAGGGSAVAVGRRSKKSRRRSVL